MGLDGTFIDNIILVSCTWLLILNGPSNLTRPFNTKSDCIIVVIFPNLCYDKSTQQIRIDMRTADQYKLRLNKDQIATIELKRLKTLQKR